MKARPVFLVLVIVFVIWLIVVARTHEADPATGDTTTSSATTTSEIERQLRRQLMSAQKQAVRWHSAAGRYLNRQRQLAGAIRFDPEVSTAINLACVVYRVSCATLWRKARCETGGTFSRYAANRRSSARGLFQFLTTPRGGTWASTPFGRFSVFDPYANSLAAAWMHENGRAGEWVCR